MKLLLLADIHGDISCLPEAEWAIAESDGIIIAGDITDFGGADQVQKVISGLSAYGKPLLAVPGNCDLPPVFEQLQQAGISLHGCRVELDGVQFAGVGGALPTPMSLPGESGEDTFRRILQQGISDLPTGQRLVLVTHQPAHGIRLDRRGIGRHHGSRAIREIIEQYKPILAVSGHIHEAAGVDQLGPTTLVNPGPFRRGSYGVAKINGNHVQVELYP